MHHVEVRDGVNHDLRLHEVHVAFLHTETITPHRLVAHGPRVAYRDVEAEAHVVHGCPSNSEHDGLVAVGVHLVELDRQTHRGNVDDSYKYNALLILQLNLSML